MEKVGEQFELNRGYLMQLEGFTNCYDRMPDKEGVYLVEDRSGKRGKAEAVLSFGRICFKTPKWSGYEIIYWKEVQT